MAQLSRKQIRRALADILRTIPQLQATYHYKPHSFQSQSPVVYITSSGSFPVALTGRGFTGPVYVNLHICTLYATAAGEQFIYTEEAAEDTMDDIEAEIRNALKDKRRVDALWQGLKWSQRSSADNPLIVDGDLYLHELIPLELEVL